MTPLTLVLRSRDARSIVAAALSARDAPGRARSRPKRSSPTTATSTASRSPFTHGRTRRAAKSTVRAHASAAFEFNVPLDPALFIPSRADRQASRVRVMISCGEPSGDLYAGALATEILRAATRPPSITGFGGDRLRAAGASLVGHFSGLSVTGLLEVARVLPRTYATYRRLVADAAEQRPDVFVAIDFPDFNFRLARALRKRGIPVVYYISPQLWAWRPGRMKTMKRDRRPRAGDLPVRGGDLPATPACRCEWVGHPLLDVMPPAEPRGRVPARRRAATRRGRSSRCCRAAAATSCARSCRASSRRRALIRQRVPDVQFVVARAPHLRRRAVRAARGARRRRRRSSSRAQTDDVLAAADVAIVASGTVDRAGGAARVPDGRRLSAVAADLPAGQAASSTSTPSRWPTSSPAAASCRS